ncbi:MAG: replication protein [Gammaproteobacteria bacterium]|nr:replication protein [Gammaproteobacteria bacterium]
MIIKPFAEQGNFTQIHNVVFDEIMARVRPSSFKVLMAIIRKTIGWQKTEDAISFSQLREITGIKSNDTIYAATAELTDMQLIIVTPGGYETSTSYRLNIDFELPSSKHCNTPPSKNCKGGLPKTVTPPLPKTVNTKETILNKDKDNYSDQLEKFLTHFRKQGHAFTKQQTQNAIVAAIGKHGLGSTLAAYERAIENGAENVGVYAAGILRNGGVK